MPLSKARNRARYHEDKRLAGIAHVYGEAEKATDLGMPTEPARLAKARDLLLQRVRELDKSTPDELKRALQRIEQAQDAAERERMKKYYV